MGNESQYSQLNQVINLLHRISQSLIKIEGLLQTEMPEEETPKFLGTQWNKTNGEK